jgi:hypothetical protein
VLAAVAAMPSAALAVTKPPVFRAAVTVATPKSTAALPLAVLAAVACTGNRAPGFAAVAAGRAVPAGNGATGCRGDGSGGLLAP